MESLSLEERLSSTMSVLSEILLSHAGMISDENEDENVPVAMNTNEVVVINDECDEEDKFDDDEFEEESIPMPPTTNQPKSDIEALLASPNVARHGKTIVGGVNAPGRNSILNATRGGKTGHEIGLSMQEQHLRDLSLQKQRDAERERQLNDRKYKDGVDAKIGIREWTADNNFYKMYHEVNYDSLYFLQ